MHKAGAAFLIALGLLLEGCSSCNPPPPHGDGGVDGGGALCSGDPSPPPAMVAPALDPTVSTNVADAAAFLYSGNGAIQTGVTAGAIDAKRVAVLRGKVRLREGAPAGGIQVSIAGHPELGSTLTRADGAFDLAVNGGGTLVVDYRSSCYCPAHRQVQVAPLDYTWVADVALIPHDSRVTGVALGAGSAQVARGSMSSDESGQRQATLIFPSGVSAAMQMGDGSSQPLTKMNVRATEFTVGKDGVAAMPAALPASSAYTYAVELSADEAIASGATGVTFNKPVSFYVENFVGFPVGGPVPVGYYDRTRTAWVPSGNGRVIGILGSHGGKADLDLDGSGSAASSDALSALGITDEERGQLATLYPKPTSLWRVPLAHFSTIDCNWSLDELGLPKFIDPRFGRRERDPCKRAKASTIECQNQVLDEDLDLVGTPFQLHYTSDRVPGDTSTYAIDIPILGDASTIPDNLTQVDVEVDVAGQQVTKSFPPTPNQTWSFAWDGKDAFGRDVQGIQPVTVKVFYDATAAYANTPAFGQTGSGTMAQAPAARGGFRVERDYSTEIGSWRDVGAAAIGGWSLSVHHKYDPVSKQVFLGNGDRIDVGEVNRVLRTVAGTPMMSGSDGDGGPATAATLWSPGGLAVGSDGSLYIADSTNSNIRKVAPDGIISTFAGAADGTNGFDGDGGPAAAAHLDGPTDIALGPDGSLYLNDRGNFRVRRIGRDGIISTIAGSGGQNMGIMPGGDGGPATQATFDDLTGLTVAPDGVVYIGDGPVFVRRVSTDGIITSLTADGPFPPGVSGCGAGLAPLPDGTVAFTACNQVSHIVNGSNVAYAGGGLDAKGTAADGLPAVLAVLSSVDAIATTPDGTLYLWEYGTNLIRAVSPGGILTTIAGNGTPDLAADGTPAFRTGLEPVGGIAVGADGTLFISQDDSTVRALAPSVPRGVAGGLLVSSPDGRQLFVFDARGRHLQTLDGLSGGLVYQFGYDSAGQLISVTDAGGGVTRLKRPASGAPTAITAPGGQATTLSVDANGYLSSVTNPAGESTTLVHSSDGLLTSLTDPRGNKSTYQYASGRLIKDTNATQGSLSLARTNSVTTPGSYSVTLTSALKRIWTFEADEALDGGRQWIDSAPNGLQTTVTFGIDQSVTTREPDGTTVVEQRSPDPRFGLYHPFDSSFVVKTPSGLTLDIEDARAASFDPNNLASLTSQSDALQVNGHAYQLSWDGASRTRLVQTPVGRQISQSFDDHGRLIGLQLTGQTPLSLSYDTAGRLHQLVRGARTFTADYDSAGNPTTLTSPLSYINTLKFDQAQRLTQRTLADGNSVGFAWDHSSNLTGVTPPGRGLYTFGYDAVHLLTDEQPPSVGGVMTPDHFIYDLDGRPTELDLADGRKIAVGYDAAGRLSTVTQAGGVTTASYDASTGNLSSLAAPGGVTSTFAWDGFLPTKTTWSGPVSGSVSHSYNASFEVSGETVDSAPAIAFQYDDDGLLTGAGTLSLTRDSQAGLVGTTTLGSTSESFGYNGFSEITSHAVSYQSTVDYSEQLTRDDLGRITTAVEAVLGTSHTLVYGYEASGRLSTVSRDGTQVAHYTYDANGNRLTGPANPTAPSYDEQDRIMTAGAIQYAFTKDGQLRTRTDTGAGTTTTYSYDERGNLLGVVLPDMTAISYLLDGEGRRIGKLVGGALTKGFLYDDLGRVVAEKDASNNLVSQFVYAARPQVPDFMLRGGNIYRLVSDVRGSVRLVLDVASGAVAQRLDYDEFGVVTSDSAPGFQPFGFAGGIYDPQTHLTRFGARDYDAETGRWTTADPIGFDSGAWNRYGYVAGDPINSIDPSGLASIGINWYDGFGGGVTAGIDTHGASICGEVGVGIGGRVSFQPFAGHAQSGVTLVASISSGLFAVEGRFDPCTGRGSARFGIGPKAPTGERMRVGFNNNGDLGTDITQSFNSGVSARVAVSACYGVSW